MLQQVSLLAEIIASLAVVASLVFVIREIRKNTAQMRRGELNAAHQRFSSWRHSLIDSSDMAAIWLKAQDDPSSLSSEQRLRFELALADFTWAYWHLWDDAQIGVVDPAMAQHAVNVVANEIQKSAAASEWWRNNKPVLQPEFARAVEEKTG